MPTAVVVVEKRVLPFQAASSSVGSESPQGNMRPSVPRAAFSHSASVGRRPVAQRQNWTALSQETLTTGSLSRIPQVGAFGTSLPLALHQALYCFHVTSVRPIQKPLAIGWVCWGLSLFAAVAE